MMTAVRRTVTVQAGGRVEQLVPEFAVSAMAWAEFMCGPVTPADVLAATAVA